ncbi:hypothetical protein EHS25_008923 [Saitozyma podzolica]|uniref:Major facilitator superfamily (MFS) profile domain-containing protein n=1 Tax=Saitozyma podzolica TaxID=1890683 RepID=A0A427YN67_9TREE|nr:hypothetical protein EHS25_008923 [Saitozyma podzolica]
MAYSSFDSKDEHIGLTAGQIAEDADIDVALLKLGQQVVSKQKEETFTQAWRNHWRAAVWSMVLGTALIMEGLDTGMLNSFFGVTVFKERFGVLTKGKWAVPAKDQTGLGDTATCGQLVGLVVTGLCQERFGSKRTFIGGMILMTATIFVAVFANDISMLYAAEFLMGIPWGMFQTLTTAYATELCPLGLRPYLSAYASLSWGVGKFLAVGILRACLSITSDWGWRLPYCLYWIFPVPLLIAAIFAPESPWWLARKGRYDEAKAVLRQISRSDLYEEGEIDGFIEYMRHTDALDRAEHARGSWLDMFRGTNLRRTEIQMGVWMTQNWNGSQIYSLAVTFLENAGMDTTTAFDVNLVLQAFSIIGVAISWVLLAKVGRRPIYILGTLASVVANIPIGALGFAKSSSSVNYGISALMILINFTFHMSIGPVCYTIVGELPASRLRARSIVFGRFVYVINGLIVGSINPYLTTYLNAKAGLFWAGTGLLCVLWGFFRLPETGGFTFAELDILFANKVPSRKFKRVVVRDALADETSGDSADHIKETGPLGPRDQLPTV